jgi:hypothetical protein
MKSGSWLVCWPKPSALEIHAWVYDPETGIIKANVNLKEDIEKIYQYSASDDYWDTYDSRFVDAYGPLKPYAEKAFGSLLLCGDPNLGVGGNFQAAHRAIIGKPVI